MMHRVIKNFIVIGILAGYTGCSDFLSTGDDPPVQINFEQAIYSVDDTLGFTVTNNTGDPVLLDGCEPNFRYNFEIFDEGIWLHYTTVNVEVCPDERTPWVELDPGEMLTEEIHLDEEIFGPGFYRVVLQYRLEDDGEFIEVPSDGVPISDE